MGEVCSWEWFRREMELGMVRICACNYMAYYTKAEECGRTLFGTGRGTTM